MVDVIGRAKVIITGDVDSRSIDQAGGKIGSALKKGAVIGVAALSTLAVAGTKAFLSFEEAEAQTRKLTNVLGNMGKSDAAPAVSKLADELRKLTGVDDEVIQGGETILATFSQVAKSAGDVGGTFERATKLSLDLAATGFGSVGGASKALGKALQDPEKGITALSRAGVTFTQVQKDQIEGFIKTGDSAKAQALILEEVEKQVGGTAEAAATGSGKIRAALDELGEAAGNVLDTLAGGKDTDKGGKGVASRIDDLTDSLNKFAESDGYKEFSKNINESGDEGGFLGGFATQSDAAVSGLGETLLDLSAFLAGSTEAQQDWAEGLDKIKPIWGELQDAWDKDTKNVSDTVGDLVDDIGGFLLDLNESASDWREAGRKLIGNFFDGFTSYVSTKASNIGDAIKGAINDALPDSLTFFSGRDGIPTITIDLPQLATGARNFAGGLALVGERGPELVGLPAGSDVYTNAESQRMMSDGGSFTYAPVFNGPSTGAGRLQDMEWVMRYAPRQGVA